MTRLTPAARFYFAFVNIAIVVVLGAQTVVGFAYHHVHAWPIISYPMYSAARYDGQHLREYRLFAETGTGERVALNAEDYGYSYWIFRRNVHNVVGRGSVPVQFVAAVCSRLGDDVRELVLENSGYFITRTGPQAGPPEELQRVPVDCAEQETEK